MEEETNLTIADVGFVTVTNNPNMDGNPQKHYVTIFMKGVVSETSKSLVNNEPDKCEEWVSWPAAAK